MRAENESTTTLDLSNLAVALNLASESEDVSQKVSKLHHWLAKEDDWLLIFDNAPGLNVLRMAFPLGEAVLGKVVITSLKENWGNSVVKIPLGVWTDGESVAFLRKRLTAGKYQDDAELKELAELLGNLPLALEQAAAYISSTPSTLHEYIQLFRERRRELWGDEQHEQPPSDYHATVATTWSISIQKVEEASPGALVLLQVCSFFAPEDIPLSLLELGKDALPNPLPATLGDPLTRNRAFTTLSNYSLLQFNAKNSLISVHKLVQDVVRDQKRWTLAFRQLPVSS